MKISAIVGTLLIRCWSQPPVMGFAVSRSLSTLRGGNVSAKFKRLSSQRKHQDIRDLRFEGQPPDSPCTVSVRNTQRLHAVNKDAACARMSQIFDALQLKRFHVDIWFCSEASIRELNGEWREKRRSTDILSFPFYEFVKPERVSARLPVEEQLPVLGEIVISPSFVHRVSQRDKSQQLSRKVEDGIHQGNQLEESSDKEIGVSPALATVFDTEQRCLLLLVHGVLHLLGYDHETQRQWIEMSTKEQEVLNWIENDTSKRKQ